MAAVFPWVADRYRDGTVDFDYVLAWEGADAAYTVGYERARVSIDGGERADWTIRVTHVFRREDGRWMLVHRHGDFAPADDSPNADHKED
jgi:ketosteroid isomerase-like protein